MKKLLIAFSLSLCCPWWASAQLYETGVVTAEQPNKNTRHKELHSRGVKLRLQEDNSDGLNDFAHGNEAVGYLMLEGEPANHKRLLWSEDFSLADETTSDNGPTAWKTESDNLGNDGDNYFEVRPNSGTQQLVAKNTDGEVIWRSEGVKISGYTDVKIAVDIQGVGTQESDDYLQVYYQLNDGPETPLINGLWRGSFANTTAMVDRLKGDELQIVIRTKNTGDDEQYWVDNVRVYTESNNRYAIQDGNWNDPGTWSYTPSGPSCSCIPDQLSDTYVDGYNVDLNVTGHTRNLTVYNNSSLTWTANDEDLVLYGNANLNIESGGSVDNQGGPVSNQRNIFFSQWNNEGELDDVTDRVGLSITHKFWLLSGQLNALIDVMPLTQGHP